MNFKFIHLCFQKPKPDVNDQNKCVALLSNNKHIAPDWHRPTESNNCFKSFLKYLDDILIDIGMTKLVYHSS